MITVLVLMTAIVVAAACGVLSARAEVRRQEWRRESRATNLRLSAR